MDLIEQAAFATSREVLALGIVHWNRLNGAWNDPAAALDTVAHTETMSGVTWGAYTPSLHHPCTIPASA